MKKMNYARRRKVRRTAQTRFYIIIAALAVALAVGIFFIVKAVNDQPGTSESPSSSVAISPPDASDIPSQTITPTEEPTPTPAPSLSPDLIPTASDKTDPSLFGFETHIYVDGVEQDSYTREDPINFSSGADYDTLQGITTYRGTNYRDGSSSFGTATITDETLTVLTDIDKTTSAIGRWRGSACTGQPLIVAWPDATRKIMTSLYDEFRNSDTYHDDFTEVIIASVDGNVYFMELSTGKKTRDPIKIGFPTKGTPSLDPRGWPIIYVGQGLNSEGSPHDEYDHMYFRAYSLIDYTKLLEVGAVTRDPTAYRTNWQAYDASPLIDAGSDTLVWPGESGVLYTIKMNTSYDGAAGTLTMDPDPTVKYTYTSTRNQATGIYGMENSPVGWRNYVFFTDNVGMLQCVDLNTMKLVYANDLENDSDVSMLLEEDVTAQRVYLYSGCEYDDNAAQSTESHGECYARKIDAMTGEILWTTPFPIYTAVGGSVDGGILASPILGKEGTTMEGLIIYTVSSFIKDDEKTTAMLVALDKNDGHVVWQIDLYEDIPDDAGWTPASAAAVYTADGKGYIVQCLFKGTIKLIRVDGATADGAKVVDSVNVSEAFGTDEPNSFEATPAVFGNTVVVGSRSGHFFFLKIG